MNQGMPTTGGSIGGGMQIDSTLFKDIDVSFEKLQLSKNLGSIIYISPFAKLAKLVDALKGMTDVTALSSLTPITSISPPVTPIGAGSKLPGLINRKG